LLHLVSCLYHCINDARPHKHQIHNLLTDANKMNPLLFSLIILLHWTYSGGSYLTTLNIQPRV